MSLDATPVLILVTGSRWLHPKHGGTERSWEWARGEVYVRLDRLRSEVDCVLHGDCDDSPDRLADNYAMAKGLHRLALRLDGFPYFNDARVPVAWGKRAEHDPRQWPLRRNDALVRRAARSEAELGNRVYVYGFSAPWARTHGTQYTLDRAYEAGLAVYDFACPRELGP